MKLSEIKDIATKIVKEMSGTGGGTAQGSTVTGGPEGEQTFTPVTVKKSKKAKKVKRGVKDVEPKLAAGKVKNNYYVTHFGYTPAPSVPNRKSKAMDYKQLFEDEEETAHKHQFMIQVDVRDARKALSIIDDDPFLSKAIDKKATDVYYTYDQEVAIALVDRLKQQEIPSKNNVEGYTDDLDEAAGTDEVVATLNNPNLEPDVKKMLFAAYRNKQITADGLIMIVDLILKKDIVNENYSQFRNKTSKREAPEQLHKAVKEIKKKLQEVDKLVKYTNRLRTEISEGEGEVKYSKHTPRALERIQEMIKHIYIEAKKLK